MLSGNFSANLVGAAAGRVVMVGSQNTGQQDIRTRTYDASSGAVLWEAVYDQAGGYEFATEVIVTAKNVLVIGGAQSSPTGDVDMIILNYLAKSGELIWTSSYDRLGGEDAALGADLKGWRLVVTGQSQAGPASDDWDAIMQCYDLRDGSLLWTDSVDEAGKWDVGNDVTIAGSRAVMVGRGTGSDNRYDLLVTGYNLKSGTKLWTTTYDGGHAARGLAVASSGDIVFAVGDESSGPASSADMMVRAYAAESGTLLWSDSYDTNGFYDSAYDVDVAGGIVVATGEGRPELFSPDMLTRAFDANVGTLLWSDQYDVANATDQAWAVDISGGKAIIAGSGFADTHDWVVRAYDLSSGVLSWQEQLDVAAGSDSARDLTNNGGNVFVVGQTQEAGSGSPGMHTDATIRAYTR